MLCKVCKYIIIVLVYWVNAVAINVIVNQAEYQ